MEFWSDRWNRHLRHAQTVPLATRGQVMISMTNSDLELVPESRDTGVQQTNQESIMFHMNKSDLSITYLPSISAFSSLLIRAGCDVFFNWCLDTMIFQFIHSLASYEKQK